jgi:UDP-N-acetylmuramoyl-L-alanyl-D-glutamate--2,6-diaminopimelate ligase
MPAEVTVADVAAALGVPYQGPSPILRDVHHNSAAVEPGTLFVAVRGVTRDGHEFVDAAVANGAVALIVEEPSDVAVPQLVVADARAALGIAAGTVHGHPADRMVVIGVTGTNGKTTVTHMIESIVAASGQVPGLIGTIGARVAGTPVELARTTPEASDLQRLLAQMSVAGVEVVALEVSSHALALRRVAGVCFEVVAFTNLSQDHLDFHSDMEDYYLAKAALFTKECSHHAVVWTDDPWGVRLAGDAEIPVTTVGLTGADVTATDVVSRIEGSSFTMVMGSERLEVQLPIPGRFNIANALIAAACVVASGMTPAEAARGLSLLPPVPGRFELLPIEAPFTLIIDYAHSPDAIDAVITEVRALDPGRITVVVGAGGDRDREKRPMMGAAAARADRVILTSDNPRSEDPNAIASEVAAGIAPDCDVVVELDRRRAIHLALRLAQPGDVVLVLGKGHEPGQEFADGRIEPFDDSVVVAEEWQGIRSAGGGSL